jgi:3-hydroxyisobutyrate dehydrogenase
MDITLLGTALLGSAIGERRLQRGHRLTVWNQTPARMNALVAAGARPAGSPAQAAEASPWLITVLIDGDATRSVLIDRIGLDLGGGGCSRQAPLPPARAGNWPIWWRSGAAALCGHRCWAALRRPWPAGFS